jgi:hypothetical protein
MATILMFVWYDVPCGGKEPIWLFLTRGSLPLSNLLHVWVTRHLEDDRCGEKVRGNLWLLVAKYKKSSWEGKICGPGPLVPAGVFEVA